MQKPLIILPKENKSGGNTEILYFLKSLNSLGFKINIVYLFSKKQKFNSLKEIINIIVRWYKIIKLSNKTKNIILTHYSTLFFASLFIHNKKLTIFIQCAEWKVISKLKYIQYISKLIHFLIFKKIRNFIFSNKILLEEFKNDFLISKIFNKKSINIIIYPIGNNQENKKFLKNFENRKNDIFLLLRNNWVKRYDLYIETLKEICKLYQSDKFKQIKIYIVDLSSQKLKFISNQLNVKYTRELSHNEFKEILSDSKILLYLSNYEGFGLPPLEAMLQGCIPIITNNNGQYNYLRKNSKLVLDKDSDAKVIAHRIKYLLDGKDKNLINNLNNLSKEAKRYYKFAYYHRNKQIKKIIQILY